MKRLALGVLLLALINNKAFAAEPCAALEDRVGAIIRMKPPAQVERGQVHVDKNPQIGGLICKNDIIRVNRGGEFGYTRADNVTVNIVSSTEENLHHVEPLRTGNLFENFIGRFVDKWLPLIKRLPVATLSRSGETESGLSIAALKSGIARVPPGDFELPLVWAGGTFPFVVEILDEHKEIVLRQEIYEASGNRSLRNAFLPSIRLTEGTYYLSLSSNTFSMPDRGSFAVDAALEPAFQNSIQNLNGAQSDFELEIESAAAAVDLVCRDPRRVLEALAHFAKSPATGVDRGAAIFAIASDFRSACTETDGRAAN